MRPAYSCALLLIVSPLCAQPPAIQSTPTRVRALLNIPYVADGHERQVLDLYLPSVPDVNPRPVIVRIHGGAWRHGDKSSQRSIANYVRKGFIGVAINYRLSQHAVFPAQIEDCKAAIRWLKARAAKYGIDPQRICVVGSSAGGHLAALLGTTGDTRAFDVGENLEFTSDVCAVVDSSGPADLLAVNAAVPGHSSHSAVTQLLGGNLTEKRELASAASPITYATPGDPPFLIIHGDADPVVPVSQSQRLHVVLQQAGVPSQLHIVAGGGHGGEAFKSLELRNIMTGFLTTNVKNELPPDRRAEVNGIPE